MVHEHIGIDKVADIIKDIGTCMLTTTGDGQFVSRPVVVRPSGTLSSPHSKHRR